MNRILMDYTDKEKWLQEITQLQSINKQLREIINFSSDGLFIVNHQGVVLEVNKAYEHTTGISREEVVGKNISDLVLSEYFDRSAAIIALQSKQTTTIVQRIKKQKYFVVTANPVLDTDKNIKMIVTSVRDVTYLHHLQEQLRHTEQINERLSDQIPTLNHGKTPLVYKSPQMQKLFEKIKQIASFPTTVLITGPSGTGKEVLGNMIHEWSSVADQAFIKVNCAAIPPELFESELFGYVSGSFTGARKEGKPGLFELANNGTILLDEIGEMPLPLQSKLLRVLQEKTITRIGDTKPKIINFRLVCSTNQNLKQLVQEKKFRGDLWYRINVVHLQIPSLHERKPDIQPLAEHFLTEFCQQYNLQKQILPETMLVLEEYSWPGNVRELKNIMEFLVVSTTTSFISPEDLPEHVKNNWDFDHPLTEENSIPSIEDNGFQSIEDTHLNKSESKSLQQSLKQFEKEQILKALHTAKSIRSAASLLGLDHASLIRKMKRLGIYNTMGK
ncbi:sigma-54 interaction domain-containing protein [Ammoniphilus sp. 3BR4]|uniref:sigma-54 interaction domain-containing protein n=1 Tax=Ammoniphilus sp. 3BR4 TaxID=3158265 RepID=UPI003465B6BD